MPLLMLTEDVFLRTRKKALHCSTKVKKNHNLSKFFGCLAHFLQHLKIQKGSNISQPQSNKKPRKKLSVATQGRCLSKSNQFQKEILHCSQKSRKLSDSQKKSIESLKLRGHFFGFAHFLQHFQNSKREGTDPNQERKSSETS